MAEYVHPPIPVDAVELREQAFDALRARVEGWEPADGNLDTWIIEAVAELAAQLGETVSDVVRAIFRYYGAKIASIEPIDATSATGSTDWTLIDDAGYTIPAGTVVAQAVDGELVAFEVEADVVVPAGSTSASDVGIVALEPGAKASGLTGELELIDPLDFVVGVELTAQTTGGADGESDEEYLVRLVEELRLMAPRPIVTEDFATMARTRIAEVDRALAVNGYNPTNGTSGNEKTVAVFVTDETGEPVSTAGKQAAADLLQGEREVNFVVHVADATYSTVDVTFTATAWPGVDPDVVEEAAADVRRGARLGEGRQGPLSRRRARRQERGGPAPPHLPDDRPQRRSAGRERPHSPRRGTADAAGRDRRDGELAWPPLSCRTSPSSSTTRSRRWPTTTRRTAGRSRTTARRWLRCSTRRPTSRVTARTGRLDGPSSSTPTRSP
jgi:uncharacterized phage protein gp47/JayE